MDEQRLTLRDTGLVAALAIAFDLCFNEQRPGLSLPLFVASLAAAMRMALPRDRGRDIALGAAVVVSMLVPLRAAESLAAMNVAACAALLGFAASGGSIAAETLGRFVRRVLALARGAIAVPGELAAPVVAARPALGRGRTALRVTVIAAPVVVVFLALLASADPVFADAVVPDLRLGGLARIASHVALIAAGAVACGALWVAARRPLPEIAPRERTTIGPAEWGTALGATLAIFAAFVVVQFAFLFGGRGRVEVTPGLTYAEYARSGFFQLLCAGALTFALVVVAWDRGRRDGERTHRTFVALAGGLVACCLVVLASAAYRLSLYQQAFGFTVARVAAWFAIGAVAAALLLLAALVLFRRRSLLFGGVAAIVLVALVAFNAVNPEAFVAQRNVERFATTGAIDLDYLAYELGADAVPALVDVRRRITDPTDRADLDAALCEMRETRGVGRDGFRSWNAGRARAQRALETVGCPPLMR